MSRVLLNQQEPNVLASAQCGVDGYGAGELAHARVLHLPFSLRKKCRADMRDARGEARERAAQADGVFEITGRAAADVTLFGRGRRALRAGQERTQRAHIRGIDPAVVARVATLTEIANPVG